MSEGACHERLQSDLAEVLTSFTVNELATVVECVCQEFLARQLPGSLALRAAAGRVIDELSHASAR